MKKYCNVCNHRCHCVGYGYYVNSNKCDACICDKCDCGQRIMGAAVEESIFKKIIRWFT